MSHIQIHSDAPQMRDEVVGARVLVPEVFLTLLCKEISETGGAQKFDGRENDQVQLRHVATKLVSAGYGLCSDNHADYVYRDGIRYLKRERAFEPLAVYAYINTVEYLRELYAKSGEKMPEYPKGTTHVLRNVCVIDECSHRGNPPWIAQVAD